MQAQKECECELVSCSQALFERIHKLVCIFRSLYVGQFDDVGSL